MKLRNKWNKLKTWQKGGIIGALLSFFIFYFIEITISLTPLSVQVFLFFYNKCLQDVILDEYCWYVGSLNLILIPLEGFIYGGIIGYIVYKLKERWQLKCLKN